MKNLLKKMHSKNGYTFLEFTIIGSILLTVAVSIIMIWAPEQVKKVANTGFAYITGQWSVGDKIFGEGLDKINPNYSDDPSDWTGAEHFVYTIESGSVKITGLKSSFTDDALIIPAEIDGRPVTAIANNALSNSNIVAVQFPSSVTTIGDGAFQYSKLKSIYFSEGLITIGNSAFADCQITAVQLPSTVTSTGASAFARNKIGTLILPSTTILVANYAFEDNLLTKVTIPINVITIGTNAFNGNNLSSIEIGGNVDYIGDGAFKNQLSSTGIVKINGVDKDRFDATWDAQFDGHFRISK